MTVGLYALLCVQDTVIALQALSAFASLSSTEQIDLKVTVATETSTVATFIIDRTNYLLYQSQEVTICTRHSKPYTLQTPCWCGELLWFYFNRLKLKNIFSSKCQLWEEDLCCSRFGVSFTFLQKKKVKSDVFCINTVMISYLMDSTESIQ